MSRIFRSLDPKQQRVTDVDLSSRQVGAQRPDRPEGGFCGFNPGGPPQQVLSEIERREQESLRLIEDAQRQSESIQAEAYRAGFDQGERAGEKLAMQKLEPMLQSFRELTEAVMGERENTIRMYEQDLIKVAYAIATEVLKTTIQLHPEVVAEVVEAALAKISKAQEATLRVSPYDKQLIEHQMRKLKGESWPPANMKVVADESIGRGGCRITTDTGDIDATLETQLRVLKSMLWND